MQGSPDQSCATFDAQDWAVTRAGAITRSNGYGRLRGLGQPDFNGLGRVLRKVECQGVYHEFKLVGVHF